MVSPVIVSGTCWFEAGLLNFLSTHRITFRKYFNNFNLYLQENDDASIEFTLGDTVSNDAVKSEPISSDISQYTKKKENVPLSRENEMSSTSDTGSVESSSSNNEQSEEDIPEESTSLTEEQSKVQMKSPPEDTNSTSSSEQADTKETSEVSVSTKETNVVEPVPESANEGNDQHDDDNSLIHPPPDLEEVDHAPEPEEAPILQSINPPLLTPLSSSKVCVNIPKVVLSLNK